MAGLDRSALIGMMIGRELSAVFPKRELTPGAIVLQTKT